MGYVVWARCGEYSSTRVWIVAVCDSVSEAIATAGRCRAWLESAKAAADASDDDSIPLELAQTCPDPILKASLAKWNDASFLGAYEEDTLYAVATGPTSLV